MRVNKRGVLAGALLLTPLAAGIQNALAEPLPGGTLDPLTIPKYVTPLVIPPVMNNTGTANDYDIAVRQFQQQILPGGIWATLPGCTGANCAFPPTTVWSYGPAADSVPAVAPDPNSQFNYPAYTIEATNGPGNMSGTTLTVDWINDLVDASGNYLPHLLPVDRSLHWANPERRECAESKILEENWQDCQPKPTDADLDGNNIADLLEPYTGPVPIVTHVHGAHVGPESDGYPEAWWLPAASNIPAGYATQGTLVNKYGITTNDAENRPGVGTFTYQNDQPSTTLWYHDHTLGMTRTNVYAGPAGFWLIRQDGGGEDGVAAASVLPGPAPVAGQQVLDLNVPGNAVRNSIREIPVVIQGRSFNTDGSLFYPANRAFFEGLGDGLTPNNKAAGLSIPFANADSDIAPIWNPEAFFNVMVVNGVSWPEMEVAPAKYRLRLLNGTNSRFLNLHMALTNGKKEIRELPFYQIGAEQSVLPHVVRIEKGYATPLPGDGSNVDMKYPTCIKKNGKAVKNCVVPQDAPFVEQAMLMGPAERADVIVDFSSFEDGDIVRMFNTGPDTPYGGFPDVPSDPSTSGQVMQFRVNSALLGASPTDPGGATPATDPWNLALSLPDADDPANDGVLRSGARDLALLEEESLLVCANIALTGEITWDSASEPDHEEPGTCVDKSTGILALSVPFAPKAAVLGTNGSGGGTVQLWSDSIAQNPGVGNTETWELWNHSADAHPIHLHLVKFKVVNRQALDPDNGNLVAGTVAPASAHEAGWKDTVIAYPGEVTRLNATFDKAGLYVWHCHIVEHEDNEMMVPFCVGDQDTAPGCNAVP